MMASMEPMGISANGSPEPLPRRIVSPVNEMRWGPPENKRWSQEFSAAIGTLGDIWVGPSRRAGRPHKVVARRTACRRARSVKIPIHVTNGDWVARALL